MATAVASHVATLPINSAEERIREAVYAIPLPKGVRLREVILDEDHDGDPAIHVIFTVSKKLDLTGETVRGLTAFQRAVADSLYKLQSERIPYVFFR